MAPAVEGVLASPGAESANLVLFIVSLIHFPISIVTSPHLSDAGLMALCSCPIHRPSFLVPDPDTENTMFNVASGSCLVEV